MPVLCLHCLLQRFKGTEPVEEVTEQVKAVKIEEKPKEVKTEVVDEVLVLCALGDADFSFLLCTYTNNYNNAPALIFIGSAQVHEVSA